MRQAEFVLAAALSPGKRPGKRPRPDLLATVQVAANAGLRDSAMPDRCLTMRSTTPGDPHA
jgi:hypothetical protein